MRIHGLIRLVFLTAALSSPAYAAPPTPTAEVVSADLAKARAAFGARGEDAQKVEEAARLFEEARAWTEATRACYQRLALHDDLAKSDDAKVRWIDRGIADACRALGVKDADAAIDALSTFGKEHAEAIYWLSALYGRKIETVWALRQATMVSGFRKLMDRAVALDESVLHGGPRRMRADFLTSAPGLFGGDFEKGAAEIDAAIALGPEFLEGYVLRAEKVRVKKKDRAGFRSDLQRVLDAREDALPDCIPEQRLAKRSAKALLSREKELFE